jgi:hypothetical protein
MARSGLRRLQEAVRAYRADRAIEEAVRLANRNGATYPKYDDTVTDLHGAVEGFARRVDAAAKADEDAVCKALTHGYLTVEANILPVFGEVVATLKSAAKTATNEERQDLSRGELHVVNMRREFDKIRADLYRAFQTIE